MNEKMFFSFMIGYIVFKKMYIYIYSVCFFMIFDVFFELCLAFFFHPLGLLICYIVFIISYIYKYIVFFSDCLYFLCVVYDFSNVFDFLLVGKNRKHNHKFKSQKQKTEKKIKI